MRRTGGAGCWGWWVGAPPSRGHRGAPAGDGLAARPGCTLTLLGTCDAAAAALVDDDADGRAARALEWLARLR